MHAQGAGNARAVTPVCATHAVLSTDNYGSDEYIVYNSYETRTTQTCNTATKGCCSSGTVLTQLVQDTSTPYACYLPEEGPNDMAIQARALLT